MGRPEVFKGEQQVTLATGNEKHAKGECLVPGRASDQECFFLIMESILSYNGGAVKRDLAPFVAVCGRS